MKIEVGTDGACSPNPGYGGWGFVTNDGMLEGYGSEPHTTNQRMEIKAVAQALLAMGRNPIYKNLDEIIIITDSKYVTDCFHQKWYVGWEKRDWHTASKTPVKHAKLWQALVKLVKAWEKRGTTITFKWVKGHAGHPLNEAADVLAVKGRLEAKAKADAENL